MRNVYLTLKRSVVLALLLFCQFAMADPIDRGLAATNTFHTDTIPADSPRVISFTPTSGKKGTVVTIFGAHFTGTFAVRFGGILADSIIIYSDTVIKAFVGNGTTGSVSVSTPDGTASKPGFTFIRDTVPVCDSPRIVSFSPTSGGKGTPVIILGAHFTGATAARFGGVLADSTIVLSDSTIRAIVGNGATGSVSVTTPCGGASKPGFTYIIDTAQIPDSARPHIYSFSPTNARQGTLVTIVGNNLRYASAVLFGGVNAGSYSVYGDTVIKARVGAGASGNVVVNTLYSGLAFKNGFTYIPDSTSVPDTTIHDSIPPHIYRFNPTHAKRSDTVYIFGHYFLHAIAVNFGGIPTNRFTVLSDTLIRAVVDTGATGAVSVISTIGLSAKNGFTYIPDSTHTPDSLARVVVYNSNATINSKLFALYPNPASGYVIWQQPAIDHITQLQLIDINGRIVKTLSLGRSMVQTTIPVSGLPAGIYKLVWSDGKNKLTKSLLIK